MKYETFLLVTCAIFAIIIISLLYICLIFSKKSKLQKCIAHISLIIATILVPLLLMIIYVTDDKVNDAIPIDNKIDIREIIKQENIDDGHISLVIRDTNDNIINVDINELRASNESSYIEEITYNYKGIYTKKNILYIKTK